MAAYSNRMSTYSNAGNRSGNATTQQVSTTTLLNALHNSYASGQAYPLEISTSLVVNTWVNARDVGPDGRYGGTVDTELGRRAWEHARRRAEDGCIILGSLHESTPSMFAPFTSSLPIAVPSTFYTAVNVLKAFTHCVTPQNPSASLHSSLAATFTLNLNGEITGAKLALSTSGLDTSKGLLHLPSEPGYRAFNVFYWLIASSSSQAEREFLNLKPLSSYALLQKSGTFQPPSYLPTEDDQASADDLRENLKAIGIKGAALRSLLSTLAAILKLGDTLSFMVDEDALRDACEEAADLLDVDSFVLQNKMDTVEREVFVGGLYEAVVDWVISRANEAISRELRGVKAMSTYDGSDAGAITPSESENGDSVSITVIEIPNPAIGKAVALRTVFDDTEGINAEMKQDGITVVPAGSSVLRELSDALAASAADLNIPNGPTSHDRELERDRREGVLEKISHELAGKNWLRNILNPVEGEGILLGKHGRFDLSETISSSRVWFQLAIHPTDDYPATLSTNSQTNAWSAASVSRQLRTWRLPEWANRRNRAMDFTADFDIEEFVTRYGRLGCKDGVDGIQSWILERGWSNGEIVLGHERIWLREGAWWEAESMLDLKADDPTPNSMLGSMIGAGGVESGYSALPPTNSGFFGNQFADNATLSGSRDNLIQRQHSSVTLDARSMPGGPQTLPITGAHTVRSVSAGDYGLGVKGDDKKGLYYDDNMENGDQKIITEQPISRSRKAWVTFTWLLTWWIPSPLLRYVGRMKRPDVRMAWREKFVLILLIFFINAIVVFYIIFFGRLLCPNWDKAWNAKEVGFHQGNTDFWVSHRGKVYDISKFWKFDHSDTPTMPAPQAQMQPFAGLDVSELINPPLTLACPHLVTDETVQLMPNNSANGNSIANHISGPKLQPNPDTALHSINWYTERFLPKMQEFYKGDLVVSWAKLKSDGQDNGHTWAVIDNSVYDLTDYFYTKKIRDNYASYAFMDPKVEELFQANAGEDITEKMQQNLDTKTRLEHMQCLNNFFYVGKTDFRESPKCQVNNYLLLAFAVILCAVILVKFLAALQLGSKRRPAPQDKFVICQVPAYTEGEDQLRKGLDSLTALAYDNKRKLICVICDGMIVGGGNDRPTPKIVLDILGVDPKLDPPALPFRSVGHGAEQLNYGKVYSGLYEFEGNVVPYIVVVKIGRPSEANKSKPGNRGKRDSQILLMSFLNRVHHRSPMSPLELEMFHQINNIIGVDPELYEYLLMVDADTSVKEDALTRLVASCANDAKIAGICGETSLENEERSWWTMIQVYEYYISHHLAKAFESLFGSVTCLPGCFCMYRLRTADKGKPLIISDEVIEEYSDPNVDTLHKKNLLSLGEDRYLTTLMTKHFPSMSYKFIPDAYALTAAPETWSVLLSQRRRWINSTIHNLAELMFLKDMCGFCCFSMRFVVFIDLFGTIILPATCFYLGYLIYTVATGNGPIPWISILMIAAVYGLQAIIFIIKRQWQHIGWMIIYIIAYPIYSFVLPIYSFWKQDDFSWGNTRIVIGEKGNKQVVAVEDEVFNPKAIPLQRWDDYAAHHNLPGRRGLGAVTEKIQHSFDEGGYEMDDIRTVYSSVQPASTILTGFPQQGHMPPQSPAPFKGMNRQSTYSSFSRYQDQPTPGHERLMSMGGMSDQYASPAANQFQTPGQRPSMYSTDNLLNVGTPSPYAQQQHQQQQFGNSVSRPVSTVNFQNMVSGPSDQAIVEAVRSCLREVDLDTVTKKQLKALAEQRLQTSLQGERRVFLDQMIDFELANM